MFAPACSFISLSYRQTSAPTRQHVNAHICACTARPEGAAPTSRKGEVTPSHPCSASLTRRRTTNTTTPHMLDEPRTPPPPNPSHPSIPRTGGWFARGGRREGEAQARPTAARTPGGRCRRTRRLRSDSTSSAAGKNLGWGWAPTPPPRPLDGPHSAAMGWDVPVGRIFWPVPFWPTAGTVRYLQTVTD